MNAIFLGNIRHVVDEKNRLAIPAKWRAAVKGTDEFGIFPWPNGCLIVFPPAVLQKFFERMEQVSIGDFESIDTLRRLTSQAESLPCDKQGRITLSEDLRRHAGIEKEALLVGVLNRFEIWSPARFDASTPMTTNEMMGAMKKLNF
jgi:MraZ protein